MIRIPYDKEKWHIRRTRGQRRTYPYCHKVISKQYQDDTEIGSAEQKYYRCNTQQRSRSQERERMYLWKTVKKAVSHYDA